MCRGGKVVCSVVLFISLRFMFLGFRFQLFSEIGLCCQDQDMRYHSMLGWVDFRCLCISL